MADKIDQALQKLAAKHDLQAEQAASRLTKCPRRAKAFWGQLPQPDETHLPQYTSTSSDSSIRRSLLEPAQYRRACSRYFAVSGTGQSWGLVTGGYLRLLHFLTLALECAYISPMTIDKPLTPHLEQFIREQLAAGRFQSESDISVQPYACWRSKPFPRKPPMPGSSGT